MSWNDYMFVTVHRLDLLKHSKKCDIARTECSVDINSTTAMGGQS